MPVVSNKSDVKLKLSLSAGLDPKTKKEVKKSKTLNNMKLTATDENLYLVASILSGLQTNALADVSKSETYILTSE